MRRVSSYVLCLWCLAPLSCRSAADSTQPLRGRLSLATKSWGVVLELPGFTVNTVETMPDGRRYMLAENSLTHVIVSLTLEQAKHSGSSCQDSLQKKAKNPPLKVKDVKFSRFEQVETMEYMVPKFDGRPVEQKSLFACEFYDDVYVDLHISKVKFEPSDETLFSEVLKSMHVEDVPRSSMELFQQASRLYLQHDYRGAIGPYSQALELEKTNPKLDKPLWYVLVDNLGMSYGITNDLQKAKQTFEYGASKDPSYPLFYYNLACTYAELNNAEAAGQYLKKAFDYKANVLPGESMPDPTKDDSFQQLLKNPDFRKLAERLAQQ